MSMRELSIVGVCRSNLCCSAIISGGKTTAHVKLYRIGETDPLDAIGEGVRVVGASSDIPMRVQLICRYLVESRRLVVIHTFNLSNQPADTSGLIAPLSHRNSPKPPTRLLELGLSNCHARASTSDDIFHCGLFVDVFEE